MDSRAFGLLIEIILLSFAINRNISIFAESNNNRNQK